jgi:pimeloyl-ACP methyl ester carboxylesterase
MARWTNRLLAFACAASTAMNAPAQTPPLWATVPDVPPLPKPEQSDFANSGGARIYSVVGLSDGAIMGLILGYRYPDRVNKLFLWGANFNTHSERTGAPDPAMKGMGAVSMARMQKQYEAMSPTKDGFSALRTKLGQLYEKEPNLTAAELGRIRAPTVIADGEHEQFISPEHTKQLARLIPGARLVFLPNVSHGGPQQDPEGFHRAVSVFLDETGN